MALIYSILVWIFARLSRPNRNVSVFSTLEMQCGGWGGRTVETTPACLTGRVGPIGVEIFLQP
jgi:hypothetical protein